MAFPHVPGATIPMVAYPVPIALPAGHGELVISVNHGPYVVSAASTSKLKIDGREVPFAGEGQWHIALQPGHHDVKLTDFLGIPIITTAVTVRPGESQLLSFRFGGWRNRVYDHSGADVTRFGLWSNYAVLAITFGVLAVLCCGGFGLFAVLTNSAS